LTINFIHSNNPFNLAPIEERAQFFGRRKEIRRVLSFLNWGQCVSVVGTAGIGKTSLVNYVAQRFVRAKHGLAVEQVFAYLDSPALVSLDPGQCFRYMREETIKQVKNTRLLDKSIGVRLEEAVREADSKTVHFGLQTLFRSAQAIGLKLVIVLDHLDALNQNPSLEEDFFYALRSLHTNCEMAYLVASQSTLDKLERVCPKGTGSPFFNIFQEIRIGPLTTEDSRQLVVTSLNMAGAQFPESVIDYILELGNNEPHRLQRAGHVTFELWQKKGGYLLEEHREEIRRRFEEMEA
jgi:AAA+ ATPase superfamily predicted ATPase